MIAVALEGRDGWAVEELFELFKTPWATWRSDVAFDAVITDRDIDLGPDAGPRLVIRTARTTSLVRPEGEVVKVGGVDVPLYLGHVPGPLPSSCHERDGVRYVDLGYDLVGEVAHVLAKGQPVAMSGYATVDSHIAILRSLLVDAGVVVVEIPPSPWRTTATVCLTHDVDFFDPRDHVVDHTLLGFLARATVGSVGDSIRGLHPWTRARANLAAVASLPLVLAGVLPNPWNRFDEYAALESGFGSTFFIVPHAGIPGRLVSLPAPERRAVRYTLDSIGPHLRRMAEQGVEIGLHGLDAWIDAESAVAEAERISQAAGEQVAGVRVHWLLYGPRSPAVLDAAGMSYDSTRGFNDAIGFAAGTSVPFRPPGAAALLELPLIIQDTALFYPAHLRLGEAEAWAACTEVWEQVRSHRGVLTTLWHMRSLAPERLWGDFYRRLLADISTRDVWAGTAREVTGWFSQRRAVRFEKAEVGEGGARVFLSGVGPASGAALAVRTVTRAGSVEAAVEGPVVEIPAGGTPCA